MKKQIFVFDLPPQLTVFDAGELSKELLHINLRLASLAEGKRWIATNLWKDVTSSGRVTIVDRFKRKICRLSGDLDCMTISIEDLPESMGTTRDNRFLVVKGAYTK